MISGEVGDPECLVRKDTACAVSSSSFSTGPAGSVAKEALSDLLEQAKCFETRRESAGEVGQSAEDASASAVFPHKIDGGEFCLFISKLSIRESRLSTSEAWEKLTGCGDNSAGVI